jgi:hypothetical protein
MCGLPVANMARFSQKYTLKFATAPGVAPPPTKDCICSLWVGRATDDPLLLNGSWALAGQ